MANQEFQDRVLSEAKMVGNNEYIHYNIANAKLDMAIRQGALKSIVDGQKEQFAANFRANATGAGVSGMSYDDIENFLSDWGVGGAIGEAFTQEMNKLAWYSENGRTPTRFNTGGGIMVGGMSLAQIRSGAAKAVTLLEDGGENAGKEAKKILGMLSKITKTIDEEVNGIIDTFATAVGDQINAASIWLRYQNGGTYIPNCSNGMFTKQDIDGGFSLINKNLLTVVALKKELASLSKAPTSDNLKTMSSLLLSVSSAFNAMGGTVQEFATVYCFNRAMERIEGEINNANSAIGRSIPKDIGHAIFGYSGRGNLSKANSALGIPAGKELKEDCFVTYTKGGVTAHFGGTIKIKQSAAFRGKGKVLPLSGFTSMGSKGLLWNTLEDLEQYTVGSTSLITYAHNLVGAVGSNPPKDMTAMWRQVMQLASATQLVTAISGTGLRQTGSNDFAAIMVVNNRVLTIPQILSKISNSITEASTRNSKFNGYTVPGLSSMRAAIKQQTENKTPFVQAVIRHRVANEQLHKARVNLTLYLGRIW